MLRHEPRTLPALKPLGLALSATALLLAAVPSAQAATGAVTAASTRTASRIAPTAPVRSGHSLGPITLRRTFTVAPGSTVDVGSARVSLARGVRPAYDADVTCTLTVYGPYVNEPEYPADVVVAGDIDCTSDVSALSVTVGLYNGVSGALISENSYVNDNNPTVATVEDSYPIDEDGYYIGGAVGYVGDPIESYFPQEAYSPDTYVEPVP